ncbi:hypothetical protein Fleli_0835 [Bernardetia litoralis DSM 6794]|uniref:Preprotein translocase subunit SecB n=1 Tax=Bernardetia litoralis (strain ATCC 23117 / DSM 6794 / NBRC 15988 / NCIMB 1366 / Fx l1 / Sio-4) TaxID=880071 RepID=I4AH58_BERLS|nr:hypothetical protein [Bernardetia litoralis]AFM03293.1 hypothetical protein Fleli_0835 [Bernardetia litoralis DSM 6794]
MEGIQFSLKKINTEQFAIVEDVYNSQIEDINLEVHINFGTSSESSSIVSIIKFQFKQNDKFFLIIEVSCEFSVEKGKWNEFRKEGKLIIPQGFLAHLAMITVGTTRGVLHSKTTNTKFNNFILPTIDVTKIVTEDGKFDE